LAYFFLPLAAALFVGVMLIIRRIAGALHSGRVTLWAGYYWWFGQYVTVYRSEDALGFWIVVGSLSLFTGLLSALGIVSAVGAIISN
jgi:hypothetical protein